MSKELEALETLFASYNYDGNYQKVIEARETIEKALERLEAIDNANPNEALKDLEKTQDTIQKYCNEKGLLFTDAYNIANWLNTIKQALIQTENDKNELAVYKLAYEWACNRIDGNPYTELIEQAKRHINFHKKLNDGEIKAGVNR